MQRRDPTQWRRHAIARRNPARVLISAAAAKSAAEIAYRNNGMVSPELVAGLIELFSNELVHAVNAVNEAYAQPEAAGMYRAMLDAMDDDDD